ncbi:MAG: site-2 protease family protein [Lentisphaeria bacterium]
MFGKGLKIFSIAGFDVKIDFSWLIIGLLVTWSLADGIFPQFYDGLATRTYWLMGLAGALGLFMSIVWHELCHSLVARQYGLPMGGITLFIFGGVAEMTEEPPNPKAEFFMALAGPVSSIILGLFLLIIAVGSKALTLADPITGTFFYLGFINLVLAGFNLFPGFPLDGGRLLRSALWHWKNDLRWATRIAANIGGGFGMALIILGILQLIIPPANIIGGVWYFILGMFLRGAAKSAYQQVLLRQSLGGEKIRQFMNDHPITVDSDTSLERLVEDYIYHYHHKVFPVLNDGKLYGLVHTRQVKQFPREEWSDHTVDEIAEHSSDNNTISPDTDAMDALSRMHQTQTSRLLVVETGELVGILSLKDLLGFFSMKVELEENEGEPTPPPQAVPQPPGRS